MNKLVIKDLEKICNLEELKYLEENLGNEFDDCLSDTNKGFSTIQNLVKDFSSGKNNIPKENGVYIVLLQKKDIIEEQGFKTKEEMEKDKKGPNPIKKKDGKKVIIPWYDSLNEKWNSLKNTNILYIGKASGKTNKLNKRIRQYVRYGMRVGDLKYATNHAGGRAIWQIKDEKIKENLVIAWFECKRDNDDENRDKKEKTAAELLEMKLTQIYKNKYGTYPIANQKQGG